MRFPSAPSIEEELIALNGRALVLLLLLPFPLSLSLRLAPLGLRKMTLAAVQGQPGQEDSDRRPGPQVAALEPRAQLVLERGDPLRWRGSPRRPAAAAGLGGRAAGRARGAAAAAALLPPPPSGS